MLFRLRDKLSRLARERKINTDSGKVSSYLKDVIARKEELRNNSTENRN